jgi:hypothetical protein
MRSEARLKQLHGRAAMPSVSAFQQERLIAQRDRRSISNSIRFELAGSQHRPVGSSSGSRFNSRQVGGDADRDNEIAAISATTTILRWIARSVVRSEWFIG